MLPPNLSVRTKENHKNLRKDIQFLGQYMNTGHPEYKEEVLSTQA
jgi:hypothetical protein